MAKNNVILLDGIIDQRLAERLPSHERDEVFEFFVLEMFGKLNKELNKMEKELDDI